MKLREACYICSFSHTFCLFPDWIIVDYLWLIWTSKKDERLSIELLKARSTYRKPQQVLQGIYILQLALNTLSKIWSLLPGNRIRRLGSLSRAPPRWGYFHCLIAVQDDTSFMWPWVISRWLILLIQHIRSHVLKYNMRWSDVIIHSKCWIRKVSSIMQLSRKLRVHVPFYFVVIHCGNHISWHSSSIWLSLPHASSLQLLAMGTSEPS